MGSVEEFVAK